jgi:hypothetical protein|tara:strand:+ start:2356 stop:2556 length:201 start_codon:yes stop_codon:yes gene_type:complete
MKIKDWVKIEDSMTDLMGWNAGIDAMCEAHREVAPKKPIYELSEREDKKLIFRLRKRYSKYKEDNN